jgi:hypothetical protein
MNVPAPAPNAHSEVKSEIEFFTTPELVAELARRSRVMIVAGVSLGANELYMRTSGDLISVLGMEVIVHQRVEGLCRKAFENVD